MADVKMPETVPCQFNKAWVGKCGKPSDNGWCSEHEALTCRCGKKAVKSCSETMGALFCGTPLCADCVHHYDSGLHISRTLANQIQEHEKIKDEVRIASRQKDEQRRHPIFNVPDNLFELLKGDWQAEGWKFGEIFLLELKQGLMGFFPAIFANDLGRIVMTFDLCLLSKVWPVLEPRPATVVAKTAYFHPELGFAYYAETEECDRKNSEPHKLLLPEEFKQLKGGPEPAFHWAFGLISGGRLSTEDFLRILDEQATKLDPSFSRSAVEPE